MSIKLALIPSRLLVLVLLLASQLTYGQQKSATYFNHVFLNVSDVDRSVEFYTTAFDLKVTNDITSMKVAGEDGEMVERDVRLVLLKFSGQNFVLEIGGGQAFTSDNGNANYAHVGVNVLDVAAASDRLINAGATQTRPITLVHAGDIEAKTAFFSGPDGETIELMELIKGEF